MVLIGYAAINDYLHLAPPPTRVAANTNIAWPSPLHRVSVKFSPYLFPALPAEVPHELAQLDVMAAPSAGLTTQQGAAIMAAAVNWIANTNQRDVLDSTKANFPPGVSAVPFAQFPSKLSDQSAMAGGLIGFSTSMVVFQQEFLERGSFGPIFFAASINGQPALYAFTVKANFYGNMLTECVTIAGPQVGFCGPSSQEEIDRSFSAGGRGVTLLSILSREP
ncbi:MAG TPA: hypothetical protein PLO16_15135 [Acidocella sp.]|nr:hypothetical protein [Acidocella sp.]